MKATLFTETSVEFQRTKRHCISEDRILHHLQLFRSKTRALELVWL
jgi:hypothetical protein